ncbi:MAG: suppressor of fused domain protein [Pirellulaceae bacterium]|jgi:hypothetical protein|nr:suppressor of fused domain protein [Thermoguttaceae bacterium]NLZ00376.1 suppressor of fused domain protein [Pirellulaceae bacterium]
MWWWFRRKRRPAPAAPEATPGGSAVDRCGESGSAKTAVAIAGAETAGFAGQRERIYEEFFGPSAQVFHEMSPRVPHIDVRQFGPGHAGRDFHTLVTSGMSDSAMSLPPGAADATSRVELILYCREPEQAHLETLRHLAHYPHDHHTWLGTGHTMPNGHPPEPIWGSPALDTFLFLPTILVPDMTLPDRLKLNGESVEFLWVVPISSAECDLKRKQGIDELLDLFDRFEHPPIFDPNRACYVAAAR